MKANESEPSDEKSKPFPDEVKTGAWRVLRD
jgi:hypothetical protein